MTWLIKTTIAKWTQENGRWLMKHSYTFCEQNIRIWEIYDSCVCSVHLKMQHFLNKIFGKTVAYIQIVGFSDYGLLV